MARVSDGREPLAVIVTGGRTYRDGRGLAAALDALSPGLLIEGGARGADALAGAWAQANAVPHLRWPADWERDGRAAGVMRNRAMARFGKRLTGVGWRVLVVAFPGGAGTANMIATSKAAGLAVVDGAGDPPGGAA